MANYYTQFSVEIPIKPEAAEWIDAKAEELEIDFSYEFEKGNTQLWLFSQEGGTPYLAVELIQGFLQDYDPEGVFTFSWAHSCSKLRPDAFGGGAVVVTAEEMYWIDAQLWAGKKVEELHSDPQIKYYLDKGGVHCPACKSNDISGGYFGTDFGSGVQDVACDTCGATWLDTYKLTGFINLEKRF